MNNKSKYDNFFSAGDKYGKWTIVNGQVFLAPPKHTKKSSPARKKFVKVRCECGKEQMVSVHNLVKGKTRGCLDCFKKTQSGNTNNAWKGVDVIPQGMITRIQKGAERRNIEYSVTPQYLVSVLQNQNYSCSLTSTPLTFTGYNSALHNASLDRIDNSKGYVVGNVQWVTTAVNMAKQTTSQDEFIQMCLNVAQKYTNFKKD